MADKDSKTAVAAMKNLNISPRKVRLVTDAVKGTHVVSAMAQLRALPNRASDPVLKLLNSAVANAREKNMDMGKLVISSITVDKGRVLRRVKAKARGRVGLIEHKQSHVNLILKEDSEAKHQAFVIPQKVKKVKTLKEEKQSKKEKPEFEEREEKAKKTPKKGFAQRFFSRKSI
ncbi:MAG: 50S ribosomal protein L22 [bacterium]|nr:50S ribosomal protein L22 [bacterium]MDZ4231354.1 50S ribosomal protein L22 [Patescibacteria group bacterium]